MNLEIYSVLFIFLLLLFIAVKKNILSETYFKIMSFTVLVIIAGFRYDIGTDYSTYQEMFDWINFGNSFEIGYVAINVFFRDILGLSFQSVVFFCSFLTILLFFKTIQDYSTEKSFSILLLVFSGFYFMSFNIIRQVLAIAFLIYSSGKLFKKKNLTAFIYMIIACSMHISAVLGIPLVIISKYITKRILIVFWLFSFCFLFLDIRWLVDIIDINSLLFFYEGYLDSGFFQNQNNLFYLKLILPNLLVVLCLNNNIKGLLLHQQFLNLYIISVILLNIFTGIPILMRMNFYAEIALIIAIPLIVNLFKGTNKLLIKFLIIIYYLIFTIGTIIMGQYGVVPYDYNLVF